MPRPLGITVTAILMVANIVCDVAISLTAPHIFNAPVKPTGPSNLMILIHVTLVAFILVELVSIFFYWLGKPWARWAVLIGCLYYLLSLRTVLSDWRHHVTSGILGLGAGVLAAYLLWYLHTERVRAWFALAPAARQAADLA